MTSSESPLPGQPAPEPTTPAAPATVAATAAPEAPVLAQGHLHPAVLLLRLVDALRASLLPLLLGAAARSDWMLVLGAVLFLAQLGFGVARYLTFEYVLTADELRTREGLLHRQERRIPLDRIQDLGFESTLFRRVLGLAVVRVETASGKGVEAVLDSLGRAAGLQLRETLLAARAALRAQGAPAAATAGEVAAAPGESPAFAVAAEPEWTVLRSTTGELLLRGLTDLRLGYVLVMGFAALQFADQLGVAVRVQGAASSFFDWVFRFPPAAIVALLVALLVAALGTSVVFGALGNVVLFHGFTLTLRGGVLHRRYGLLTTRSKALPRARIQRVTIEQNWLRRLAGLAVVKADSAGSSRGAGEDTAGGWDVVSPMCRLDTATAVMPALLPGIERAAFAWQPTSKKLIVRLFLQGVLAAAVLIAAAWAPFGPLSLLALVLLPLAWLVGVLSQANLGWSLGPEFLALRHGVLGRYHAFVPAAKVQAVVLKRGPLAQLLGLAELTVYVAGGSPTRLPDLVRADAEALRERLAGLAAAAAARDWAR